MRVVIIGYIIQLNGRAYTSVGQAGASLHIMGVLKVYQADLLGDLDQGVGPLRWLLSCATNESSSPGHHSDCFHPLPVDVDEPNSYVGVVWFPTVCLCCSIDFLSASRPHPASLKVSSPHIVVVR